jgi:hypothetical protein
MRTAAGSRHTTPVGPSATVHQPSIRARDAAHDVVARSLTPRSQGHERQNCEAGSGNEPDQAAWHLGGRWLAGSLAKRHDAHQHRAARARNQEDVRAPALVRRRLLHLAQMRPAVPTMGSRRPHQAVQAHQPPNALAVVAAAKDVAHKVRRRAAGLTHRLRQPRQRHHRVGAPTTISPGVT